MSVKKLSRSKTMAILLSLSLMLLMIPMGLFATADTIPATPDNVPVQNQEVVLDTSSTTGSVEATPSVPVLAAVTPINSSNTQAVTITGTADPTTTVIITAADEATGSVAVSATASATGSFNAMVDVSSLRDGVIKFTAVARSANGITSDPSMAVTQVKDTVSPITGSITSPAPDSIVNTSTPKLLFSISDADVSGVVVKVDDIAVTKKSGDALDPLADGQHNVTVEVIDAASNASVARSNFTVDTHAPVVTITSPVAGSTTNTTTPQLTFTVSEGTATVQVDGSAVGKKSGDKLDALSSGSHTVKIDTVDTAGNVGSSQVTFTVDTTGPVVSITSPASGSVIVTTTPQLVFTAGDATGTPAVRVDGSLVDKKSGDKLAPLTEGTHTVSVEATDSIGNKGSSQSTFTVTTHAPAVVSTDPTSTANNVVVNKDIVITFSDDIQEGTTTAYSGIVVTSSTSTAVSITKSISGKTLTIHPTFPLAYGTSYAVTIPAGAVKNAVGYVLAGTYSFSFTTQANPAVPAAPTGLKVVSNNGFISLAWDASKDTSVTGYNVYRKEKDATSTPVKLNSAQVTTAQYQDKTAKKGTVYIYYVTALKAGLESPVSNQVEGALTVTQGKTITWPKDVLASAPNAKALKTYLTRGIFSTDADGKFHPDKAITRAEFAKAIYFMVGGKLINPTKPAFPDVAKTNWSYQYVERLKALGIMIGYPNKAFRPNNSITRAEVSKVAALVRKLPSATTSKLKDIGSSWAKGFINSCVKAGLFKGNSDNTFKPNGTVTRSQAVDILDWVDK
ncbi:MAG: S-layer homology domain-containing protein [Candidatus Aquicultor sp.]